MDEIFESCIDPNNLERIPDAHLLFAEEGIKNFSAVYTNRVSSTDPLDVKGRESMARNVITLARKNLSGARGDKIVDFELGEEEIFNFVRDDTRKNKSTKKAAILLQKLEPYIKSIGRISCGDKAGTCWLVSDTEVITCHHVYRSFVDIRKMWPNFTLPIKVKFDFFYREHSTEERSTVEVDEQRDPDVENSHLDYKFLRLHEHEVLNERVPLGQFVRNYSPEENLVVIIGHPGGEEMKEETCVVADSLSWSNQLEQRRNSAGIYMTDYRRITEYEDHEECLPYDTTLFSGASGSPVFDLNGNIVAMHAHGSTLEIGGQHRSLMEFGVQFSAICEDLRSRDLVLLDTYFPDYNFGPNENRMDQDLNEEPMEE